MLYGPAGDNGSVLLTFGDTSSGLERKAQLTTAGLRLTSGNEWAMLAPDAGLEVHAKTGIIVAGATQFTKFQPRIMVVADAGITTIANTGIVFTDKQGKLVGGVP